MDKNVQRAKIQYSRLNTISPPSGAKRGLQEAPPGLLYSLGELSLVRSCRAPSMNP